MEEMETPRSPSARLPALPAHSCRWAMAQSRSLWACRFAQSCLRDFADGIGGSWPWRSPCSCWHSCSFRAAAGLAVEAPVVVVEMVAEGVAAEAEAGLQAGPLP